MSTTVQLAVCSTPGRELADLRERRTSRSRSARTAVPSGMPVSARARGDVDREHGAPPLIASIDRGRDAR
jgi:hypothetical protein